MKIGGTTDLNGLAPADRTMWFQERLSLRRVGIVRQTRTWSEQIMTRTAPCVQAYWAEFLATLDADDRRRSMTPDCFSFAGGGDLGDRLLALVLSGRKRATASLPIEYTGVGESLPLSGDLTIVLDSQGRPSAIIERTSVRVVAFEEVSPEFAKREGEGDGSLKYWREAHARYFGTVCKRFGGTIEPETAVLCQEFELVWPVT